MRDFIIIVGFLGLLPLCFLRPAVGMMVWTWFTIMNPHREAFGFAQTFNFNMIIAAVTLLGSLVSNDVQKRYPLGWVPLFFLFWAFWTFITCQYALIPQVSWDFFMYIPFKVFIYTFMLFVIIDRPERLLALIWVLCISIGYYGARIGLVSLLEGGKNLGVAGNFGPYGTMIQDRNHLSLAIVMILPLLHFLRIHSENLFIRRLLMGVFSLSILTVLSSYSRGALVALVAAGGIYALRSQHRVKMLMATMALILGAFVVMPAEWTERMTSTTNRDKDASWQGRVAVWHMALNIADERPFVGGGFRATEQPTVAAKYGEELKTPLAVHSIYMQVIADHGYMGLALFLSMLLGAVWATVRVRAKTATVQTLRWAYDLAGALQASFAGFMVGGAALSLAYYDGLYVLVVTATVLWLLVSRQETLPKPFTARLKASSVTNTSP